ncbi:MAG: tRNA (adenosine(37)-N6)-threonylcarbamoyltransferase complex ATPase subunit type 1 TsaE [Oscillospiraceae bacterium]|nr:tRNA (adenosine(37)-N6)-threonylcarbamoyltransferase complex ATPase subunit type 1 TsaE [Oscillospiraceae bacterium]
MKEYLSLSPLQTVEIGREIANMLKSGDVIALFGDLGMGKTCLISGIADGLGFSGEVSSPTFALVNEYIGGRLNLYHFDMYRVEGWEDLYSTGYFDYLESGGVLAIEWSENIVAALPESVIEITIERTDETQRKITVEKRAEKS